jgi:hypothetical protein
MATWNKVPFHFGSPTASAVIPLDSLSKERDAATLIQCCFRRNKARQQLSCLRQERDAATLIQFGDSRYCIKLCALL